MPIFSYIAKDASGNPIKAKEFALSEQDLKMRLVRQGLIIISIKEARQVINISFFKPKIKTSDLVLFCKQLATMVKGGVPLLRAINSISDELKNPLLKGTLGEISHLIKGGESLSGSLKRFPNVFSNLFVAIVEAGEKVGSLDTMLERLSSYLEARDRLNRKIKAAMTYPAFVVSFFLFAMAVITLFLIPRFKAMYAGLHAKLPVLTEVVFSFSDAVLHNIIPIVAVTGVSIFIFNKYFLKTRSGRSMFDKFIMEMPVFGNVIMSAALSKFTRTLATLLSQGIPIAISLELVSKTSGNLVMEERSLKVRDLILDGESIPEALKKVKIFPSLMIQMAIVGVESGSLPDLLDKTATFYEERVDAFVSALTSMIEPVLIVALGGMVGVVIVALYMPIFSLSQAMSGGH
jgi:type IV pilus assembly protein PilC